MDRLPEEVLGRILSLLDARSLCRCEEVCSTWRLVSQDEGLWRLMVQRIWPSFSLLPEELLCFSGVENAAQRGSSGELGDFIHQSLSLLKWFLSKEYPITNWKQVFAAMYYRDLAMPHKLSLRSEAFRLQPCADTLAAVEEIVDAMKEQVRVYPWKLVNIDTRSPPLSEKERSFKARTAGGLSMAERFLEETMSIEETTFEELNTYGGSQRIHLVLTQFFALHTGELIPMRYRHRWSIEDGRCMVALPPLLELEGSPYHLSVSAFLKRPRGSEHCIATLRHWRQRLGLDPAHISLLELWLVFKRRCTTLEEEGSIAPTVKPLLRSLESLLAVFADTDTSKAPDLPSPAVKFSDKSCRSLFTQDTSERLLSGELFQADFGTDSDSEEPALYVEDSDMEESEGQEEDLESLEPLDIDGEDLSGEATAFSDVEVVDDDSQDGWAPSELTFGLGNLDALLGATVGKRPLNGDGGELSSAPKRQRL